MNKTIAAKPLWLTGLSRRSASSRACAKTRSTIPKRGQFTIICPALICLVVAAFPITTATWDAIDLGTLGGNQSEASAINIHGQVVGWSDTTNGVRHGFSWTPAGGMVAIGSTNDVGVNPTHVLDNGQVIGSYERLDANFGIRFTRAFSWTAAGGMVDIGVLPGRQYAWVRAVSPSGQVVGDCCSDSQAVNCRAFSWKPATGMIDLGTIGGASGAYATAVSENGVVAGYTSSYDAFAWTASGGMVGLGRLPGYNYSTAAQVNGAGMVVGTSGQLYSSTQRRGFVWTTNGGMRDVGHLGGEWSLAQFVSSNGTVVGTSGIGFGLGRAFAWTTNGGITNLGALGGSDSAPLGMNKSGLVMGTATGNQGLLGYAFAWSASNGMRALTLGGNSSPRAISDGGHIVGTSGGRGFLWEETHGIIELLPLPRDDGGVSDALAVNSRGQVVGWSPLDGWRHAVLWQQPPPVISLRRSTGTPGTYDILIDQLVPNNPFTIEWSVDFADWEPLGQHVPTNTSKTVSIVPAPDQAAVFYRIRIP